MRYYLLFFWLLIFVSCNSEFISVEVKQSYEEVMRIHDEIMPEVSTIRRLKKKVKKVEDSSDEKSILIKQLEDANEGMMAWMAQFDLDRKVTEKQQLEYLNRELKKITKVSDDMVNTMKVANEYLKSNNQ